MDYFCVDIETSGPVPGVHSLLSLGAVHVRRASGSYRVFEDLYLELKPTFPGVYPPAMAIHHLDLEVLQREGTDPKAAMTRLVEWVSERKKSAKERPVFVAHNAPFDWMFCVYYFHLAGLENPFGHSAIDTKALAMGQLNLSWNQTSLRQLAEILPGMSERDPAGLHHALEDARYQARVFAALMNQRP